jgi:hypothetical protein
MWLLSGLGCMDIELRELEAEPIDSAEPAPEDAEAPVADAGRDREVSPLETVSLDGTASRDPAGGRIVAWHWSLVSRPSGSTTDLEDPEAERPTFFADLAGDYVFALTVKNDAGVWDESPDDVIVTATPLDGFYVELSWDTATDLDLHLAEGDAALFGPRDCSFCNMTPDFGGSSRADDASLDWDAIDGWGPETITIDAPASGDYTVRVHFYGDNRSCGAGCPPTTATVRVFLGGVLAEVFTQRFTADGQLWEVAAIDWPSGRIQELDGLGRTNQTGCD